MTPRLTDAAAEPTLFFGSVDEFVRERLRYTYSRRVGPQGPNRWAADWWRYPEAISRLDALWRSWEALRLEPTFGMSVWWRDHADHHMRMLMSPEGPFADSRDENKSGDPFAVHGAAGRHVRRRASPAKLSTLPTQRVLVLQMPAGSSPPWLLSRWRRASDFSRSSTRPCIRYSSASESSVLARRLPS